MRPRSSWHVAVFALALGCGSCKRHPQPIESAQREKKPHNTGEPHKLEPIPATSAPDGTNTQRFGEDARMAKVVAQEALLGSALFEDASGSSVPWISPQDPLTAKDGTPALNNALLDRLPGSSGLGAQQLANEAGPPRINGNALGRYQPLLFSSDGPHPLARFYAALRRLHGGTEPDGKVRVLMYGASHTDADIYTHYVRAYLRSRFGDGGHGFVHVARPWKWYGHVEMLIEGFDGWFTEHAQRVKGRNDGYYGLMGASLSATRSKAWGRVTPRENTTGSNYELYFLVQPKGGSFRVTIDGVSRTTVSTHGDAFAAGYHTLDLPEGQHSIELQPLGNGEVRLFGMTIESDAPGIVVDTLGVGGTRASNMLKWDSKIWHDNLRRRDPELIVLAYGTNEANSGISRTRYEGRLRDVLGQLKQATPNADCLLVGPGDFPKKSENGSFEPRPSTTYILEAQRQIALEMGCGFWDLRAFMGGEMSMTDWVTAVPPMAKADHIHLTRRGYVRMGMGIADAMMVGYDEPRAP